MSFTATRQATKIIRDVSSCSRVIWPQLFSITSSKVEVSMLLFIGAPFPARFRTFFSAHRIPHFRSREKEYFFNRLKKENFRQYALWKTVMLYKSW